MKLAQADDSFHLNMPLTRLLFLGLVKVNQVLLFDDSKQRAVLGSDKHLETTWSEVSTPLAKITCAENAILQQLFLNANIDPELSFVSLQESMLVTMG